MKNMIKITACVLLVALYSCNGNKTTDTTKCADSVASAKSSTIESDSMAVAGTNDSINMSMTAAANENTNGENEADKASTGKTKKTAKTATVRKKPEEPTGGARLVITSTAFANGGVIPVKYTCDGQGVTPPLNFGAVLPGTKSYAVIVHDYDAYPTHGFTYWIIWNIDTSGFIPENFRSSHENMNAAGQYGYTPICSKSGDHKYHFIVYALDTRMILGKNTTKGMIESTMKNHILGRGELVGVYNKKLE